MSHDLWILLGVLCWFILGLIWGYGMGRSKGEKLVRDNITRLLARREDGDELAKYMYNTNLLPHGRKLQAKAEGKVI